MEAPVDVLIETLDAYSWIDQLVPALFTISINGATGEGRHIPQGEGYLCKSIRGICGTLLLSL